MTVEHTYGLLFGIMMIQGERSEARSGVEDQMRERFAQTRSLS